MKPRIAITSGDPSGIGPEIAARAAGDPRVLAVCDPVVYAPPDPTAFAPGVLSARAGQAAYEAILRATDDALSPQVRARRGDFDVVVACYHDQGLIPVKLLAFGQAVNVTLGLPIIRTSVDHGTAFDIAGKGIADPESMVSAVLLAARLSRAA